MGRIKGRMRRSHAFCSAALPARIDSLHAAVTRPSLSLVALSSFRNSSASGPPTFTLAAFASNSACRTRYVSSKSCQHLNEGTDGAVAEPTLNWPAPLRGVPRRSGQRTWLLIGLVDLLKTVEHHRHVARRHRVAQAVGLVLEGEVGCHLAAVGGVTPCCPACFV